MAKICNGRDGGGEEDPYLELEMYLEKVQVEIGEILERKQVTNAARSDNTSRRRLSCPLFGTGRQLTSIDAEKRLFRQSSTDRKFLTADFYKNRKKKMNSELNNWSMGLMARFNSIIEDEIEKLRSEGDLESPSQGQGSTRGQRSISVDNSALSPWAKRQLSIIEESQKQDGGENASGHSIDQLTADIEETQQTILRDLDLLERDQCLNPEELEDFLRRVEAGIRVSDVAEVGGANDSTSTFDAATQTTPVTLSRSSSFVWVSDCAGSVDSVGDSSILSASTPDDADDSGDGFERCATESGIGTASPHSKGSRRCKKVVESSSGSDCESSEQGALNHKKKERLKRRETWERLRRRNSSRTTNLSRRNTQTKDKDKDVVWIPRTPVPLTREPRTPTSTSSMDRIAHKPPPNSSSSHYTGSLKCSRTRQPGTSPETARALGPAGPPVRPVHLRLAELEGKSSSVPLFLEAKDALFQTNGQATMKTLSANNTPTDPSINLQASLVTARSHSQTAFAEIEAQEACRWLKAAGFPQYAQMYEDWQFPVDLEVVERDHHFLDADSLNALFRRLAILNRTAALRSNSRSRPQGIDSDEEDQECALSDQWTFQRDSRRWSRVDDIPQQLMTIHRGSSSSHDDCDAADPGGTLGNFRRSNSERLRQGAKSFLRRMESLRSRGKRRSRQGSLLISEPQIIDPVAMEQRTKDLGCTQITPASSTSPSPDLNRTNHGKGFDIPEPCSLSATPSPCSSVSSSSVSKHRFFRTRKDCREAFEILSDSEYSPSHSLPNDSMSWNLHRLQSDEKKRDSRSLMDRFSFRQSPGKKTPPTSTPEEEEPNFLTIRNKFFAEADLLPPVSALNGRTAARWHSFRMDVQSPNCGIVGPLPVASLSVGQFALLRKLALLRLTALLERYAPSTKHAWNWDLTKFIKKSKPHDYKGKNFFGVPLTVIARKRGQSLPAPILQAMDHLRKTALDQVGIFRKSGVKSRIARLKEICENQENCENVDFADFQPFDVADMIKQYFRELPESLLTTKLSETFLTIYQVVPPILRLEALRCAILLLPDTHREALHTFLSFIVDVAALSPINQMNANNLAVCLAPSFFYLPSTAVPRRKNLGAPDPRELSENKAANECLVQMIKEFSKIFVVSKEMLLQCRFTYLEQSVPVSLEDLYTVEFGDWQSYMNGMMASITKEAKEKSRGWTTVTSSEVGVEIAWKKIGDGHPLRLWRFTVDLEAPPTEVLTRLLRERHLWDETLTRQQVLKRFDKHSEVFCYSCSTYAPRTETEYCVLRTWRNDLPRGTCLLAETSIDHEDAPEALGATRGIVLVSGYLIEPCGAGKSRLVHFSRMDRRGRSLEWYNKMQGCLVARNVARIRSSFSHVTEGPESKV